MSDETRSFLSLERIQEACDVIPPVFRESPQFVSAELTRETGRRILCKVECVNPIRSFKGRGACFLMAREPTTAVPLVTASAGNFGQGLAYGARLRGQRLLIFAATTANPDKVDRMRELGADVRLAGEDFDAAKDEARAFAERQGLRFIEDGREPAIAEGAGTIAVELGRWTEPIAAVVVPVGNGALINGVGRWIHAHAPGCQVIGVCAEGAPAMARSWRAGRNCTTNRTDTTADGIAVRVPIPEALKEMRNAADQMIEVGEEPLRDAVQSLHRSLGLVVEPSGAAALAAVKQLRGIDPGGLIAVILTGGNLSADLYREWLR